MVLLIASTTGYQTQMFAEAAQRLGIDLLLATDRCHVLADPWGDQAVPIRFEDPESSALPISARGDITGIVALGDRAAVAAAAIAQRLGIRYNSVESVQACHNKFLARQKFQAAGLPVPRFERLPLASDPSEAARRWAYPCVLKPLTLSGSRGVIRADSPLEFQQAFERIRKLLDYQTGFLQVEAFIPGMEFALEGILENGELKAIALFDKPDPLNGPFFEETIYVTPSRLPQDTQHAIAQTTQRAVNALGLEHGPVHAEMRVNPGGVWMLEVAARPIGGLCARVLPGLPERILQHASGSDGRKNEANDQARGVMMIPIPRAGVLKTVTGIENALAVPGIEDVVITAKAGQRLIPLPEGASYLGFVFSNGPDPAAAESALRTAHSRLRFEILGTLPVL